MFKKIIKCFKYSFNKNKKTESILRSDRYKFERKEFNFIDNFSKEVFRNHFKTEEEYEEFIKNAQKKNKALLRQITCFYYWRAWKPLQELKDDDHTNPLPDFVIIILLSVIEKLILTIKSEIEGKSAIKYFFDNYINEDDIKYINNNFSLIIRDGKKDNNREDFTTVLYNYRNKFIHQAEFLGLVINNDFNTSDSPTESKIYKIEFSIKKLCEIIERGIISYFS